MKNIVSVIISFILLSLNIGSGVSQGLKVGDKAPLFSGKNQHDKLISLAQFKGKKIILYFYPKDNTPGCTQQSCNLRDNYKDLIEKGFVIIGINNDDIDSHRKFSTQFSLPFNLIADEDKKIVNDYHVFGENNFGSKTYIGIRRTTFLINEQGIIQHIINKPDTENHTAEILNIWK